MLRFSRPTHRATGTHPLYRQGPHFDGSGAGIFIYEQQTTNPLYMVQGAGRINRKQLRVTQPPPAFYAGQRGITSIGGTQAGMMYSMPLYQFT